MTGTHKGFFIKPHKQYPNNYVVSTEGKGGKIPSVLDTMYTSRGLAREEIDRYLLSKGREPVDAKDIS